MTLTEKAQFHEALDRPILPNTYDQALQLFVSKDELRPKMLTPCQRGDFVYATDAYAAIKVPVSKPRFDYSQTHDFYEIEPLFQKDQNYNKMVDFAPITEWFNTVPTDNKYEECPRCEGLGEIYCECCKNNNECKACLGSGNGRKIGEEKRKSEPYILKGVKFSYMNLYRLFLASSPECSPVEWVYRDTNAGNLFRVNDIDIVLLPMGF